MKSLEASQDGARWATYHDAMKKISVIDSHTGGEPTRLIISGGPDLGAGTLSQQLQRFRDSYDHIRSAAVCEPRGSDVVVGALLCTPNDPSCSAGVIFFNNVGFLGMCGHGTIGLVASLAYLGRIGRGLHRIETPVGIVDTELHEDGSVTVHNVPAYRSRKRVAVEVEGYGRVEGDVAWGGNWFFLIERHGLRLALDNVGQLTEFSSRAKRALEAAGITGDSGAPVDHIELFGSPVDPANNSRSFVLCPGNAYDRSPCGTGTSAKLACLAADRKLRPGETWRQESIIGSVFEASYRFDGTAPDRILPSIRGRAFVNAEAELLLDEHDPFIWGIR